MCKNVVAFEKGEARAVSPGASLLYVSRRLIVTANGSALLRSTDGGTSFALVGQLGTRIGRGWAASHRLLGRLLRAGFHSALPLSDGRILAVVAGGIVCSSDGGELQLVHRFRHGSRPLRLVELLDGTIAYGEYWGNSERDAVRIVGAVDRSDITDWQVLYEFPRASIRHIHALVPDAASGSVVVLTGDTDAESRILAFDSDFRAYSDLFSGSQQARAIAMVPLPEGLCYATDTPEEQNHLYLLERSGSCRLLTPIAGSGFYSSRVGSQIAFSTAIEPSRVNTESHASVYVGSVHGGWQHVLEHRRSHLPLKLFQYGTFVLPAGPGNDHLWFTPWALRGHHGGVHSLITAPTRSSSESTLDK